MRGQGRGSSGSFREFAWAAGVSACLASGFLGKLPSSSSSLWSPVSICSVSLGGSECYIQGLDGTGRKNSAPCQSVSFVVQCFRVTDTRQSTRAVVQPWWGDTREDLCPICRGLSLGLLLRKRSLGVWVPVTCCVQLRGASPSRAVSGMSRAPTAPAA